MVDYSKWIADSQESVATTLVVLVALFTTVLAMTCGLILKDKFSRSSALSSLIPANALRLLVVGAVMLAFSGAVMLYTSSDHVTFTTQTERVYNITHLRCGDQEYADRLPDDGQKASWVRAGRFEEGRFLIDGDKVGLVGSDGKLLKAMKQ